MLEHFYHRHHEGHSFQEHSGNGMPQFQRYEKERIYQLIYEVRWHRVQITSLY